ncbi:MAG: hypothetical protein ACRCZF_11300, partial [Gemmataceae bacterium]
GVQSGWMPVVTVVLILMLECTNDLSRSEWCQQAFGDFVLWSTNLHQYHTHWLLFVHRGHK